MFYIGDAARAGEAAFGERYAQVIGDYAPETVRNAMWVCGRIEPQRRRPETLSFSAHQAVAALDPDEQDEVLQLAETEGWRTTAIKAEVKRRKEARGAPCYAHNGGPAIEDADAAEYGDDEPGSEAPCEAAASAGVVDAAAMHQEPVAAISGPPYRADTDELSRCIEAVWAITPSIVQNQAAAGDVRSLSHHLFRVLGQPLPSVDRLPLNCTDDALLLVPPPWRHRIKIDKGVNSKWVAELRRSRDCSLRSASGMSPHLPAAVCEAALSAAIDDILDDQTPALETAQ
jgi:hypothetical protein